MKLASISHSPVLSLLDRSAAPAPGTGAASTLTRAGVHQAALRPGHRGRLAPVAVEAQPLAANIQRVAEALEYLGAPLPADLRADLTRAGQARDAKRLQELLDPRVLLAVHINPEARVKVARGPAPAVLQQAGYTPVIVKIVNESARHAAAAHRRARSRDRSTRACRDSPASGCSSSTCARTRTPTRRTDRFLDLEMFTAAADDGEPQRARSRVRDRADLLERVGPPRGHDRRSTSGRGRRTSGFARRSRCLFTSSRPSR